MVKKRKVEASEDFAFDDDTSDEEGLEDFQMKVDKLKPTALLAAPQVEGGSDVNDDSEEEESEEDGDESGEESSDDEDSEEDAPVEPDPELSKEKKLKLSRLQEQLANIGEASDSESESDDDSEDEIQDNDDANLQDGDDSDEDELSEEDEEDEGDIKSDDKEAEEEDNQDQSENSSPNKKLKLEPSSKCEETSEEKARKKYRDQLAKMSIEDIQKLKERLGLKLFNQKMEGTAPERGKKVIFCFDQTFSYFTLIITSLVRLKFPFCFRWSSSVRTRTGQEK